MPYLIITYQNQLDFLKWIEQVQNVMEDKVQSQENAFFNENKITDTQSCGNPFN